jgi:hypothetical protein
LTYAEAANIVRASMVESLTRALTVCAMALGVCLATNSSGQELVPETIVSVGENTYKIRVQGKLLHVVGDLARKRASEYCARMKQTVAVKDQSWDLGYGYTLTWSCVPPQPKADRS